MISFSSHRHPNRMTGSGARAAALLVLIAALAVSSRLYAGTETTRLAIVSGSSLTLDGSSNIAKWHCRGNVLHGNLEIPATMEQINAAADELDKGEATSFSSGKSDHGSAKPRFELRIPIARLDCGNPKMKRDMDRALKSDLYPDIVFRFTDLQGAIVRHGARYRATVAGEISLAGRTRNVELTAETSRSDHEHFTIQSSLPMLMTDFGITPPTGLFGMIKARNRLVVHFDVHVASDASGGSAVLRSTEKRQ